MDSAFRAPLRRAAELGKPSTENDISQFGHMGSRIFSPEKAVEATENRIVTGYDALDSKRDLVIGEFLGDADMLITTVDGGVLASVGSSPRSEWGEFANLDEFLGLGKETVRRWAV